MGHWPCRTSGEGERVSSAPHTILAAARTVLVVDWPSADVPEALARAGFDVVVHGGPGPADYTRYEVTDGEVVTSRVGRPPDRAEVVYTFRPLGELPGIVEQARSLGAAAVWLQSGVDGNGEKDPRGCWLTPELAAEAREIVEAAGLVYLDQPYIGDAARELGSGGHLR